MSTEIEFLITLLIILLIAVSFYALDQKKKYEGAKKAYFDMLDKKNNIKKETSRLLWYMYTGNQREKIPGSLLSVLKLIYPGFDDNFIYRVKEKIMRNIK